ncbi:hypothetical protein N7457_007203 [Penicillium paradoxum]|uniref:uncharacterized protein n=1 Tax=Penicillium paradoxum TaxID=176176 RepID=UPI0025498E88|nr:uncharacterized protein N7457_007203 [Penicillium paradoxum]KAJ5779483.1 hypothetical protein N7457_007203 [Penicillium paradoxum]
MSQRQTIQFDTSESGKSNDPFNADELQNKSPKKQGGDTPFGLLVQSFTAAKLQESETGTINPFKLFYEDEITGKPRFSFPQGCHLSEATIKDIGERVPTQPVVMQTVIRETQETTAEILKNTELQGTRNAYIGNAFNVPVLQTKLVEFPRLKSKPEVRVIKGDTYDMALDMYKAENKSDHMPICVLNFANAQHPGGGWLRGARAQEEQLFYRSTLSGCLNEAFYPLEELDCLYSPYVVVFRENVDKSYEFMKTHGVVSVISMAAQRNPPLTKEKDMYKNKEDQELMKAKIRGILRLAGHNNHRRLALGALGCGAFGHPAEAVSNCWKDVLLEAEFSGWFERIHFIIRDAPNENNYDIFLKSLNHVGLAM